MQSAVFAPVIIFDGSSLQIACYHPYAFVFFKRIPHRKYGSVFFDGRIKAESKHIIRRCIPPLERGVFLVFRSPLGGFAAFFHFFRL